MEKWINVKLFYLVRKKKKRDYEKCNLYKFTLLISISYYIKKKLIEKNSNTVHKWEEIEVDG